MADSDASSSSVEVVRTSRSTIVNLLDSDSDSDSDGSPLLAREQQQDLAPRLAFSHQQPQQRRSAGNAEHSKRDAFAFVESSLLRLTPSYASSAVSTPQPGVVTGENKRQSLDRESPDSMIDPSLSTLQTPCFARLSVGSSTAASQEQLVPSTSTASPISETDSLPSPSEQPSGRVAAGISIHRPANHSSPGCVSDSEDETQSFDFRSRTDSHGKVLGDKDFDPSDAAREAQAGTLLIPTSWSGVCRAPPRLTPRRDVPTSPDASRSYSPNSSTLATQHATAQCSTSYSPSKKDTAMAMSAKKRGKQPQHPRYFRTECPWIDEELPYDTDTSSEDNSSSSEEEFTPASHTLKQQQREESDSDWEMNAPSHLVKPKTNIKKKRKLQPPSKPKADKPRATPKKKAPQQRRPTAKQSAKKKRQQEPETFECIDVLSGQHFQSTTSTSFPTSLSISQNQPEPTFTLPSETEASALVPPPHSLPPPPATVVSDDDPPSLSFTFPDVSSVSSPPFPAEQTQQQADEELFRQIQLLHEADASQKDNLNDWTAEKSADASFDLSQFVNLDVPPIDPDLFHEDGLEESSTSTTITTPVDLPDPEFNKFHNQMPSLSFDALFNI